MGFVGREDAATSVAGGEACGIKPDKASIGGAELVGTYGYGVIEGVDTVVHGERRGEPRHAATDIADGDRAWVEDETGCAVLHVEVDMKLLVAVLNFHGQTRREEPHLLAWNGVDILRLHKAHGVERLQTVDVDDWLHGGVGYSKVLVALHGQEDGVGSLRGVHLMGVVLREASVVGVEREVEVAGVVGEDVSKRGTEVDAKLPLNIGGQLCFYLRGDVGVELHGVVHLVVLAAVLEIFVNTRCESRGGDEGEGEKADAVIDGCMHC